MSPTPVAVAVAETATPLEQAELAVVEMEAAGETKYQRKAATDLVAVADMICLTFLEKSGLGKCRRPQ